MLAAVVNQAQLQQTGSVVPRQMVKPVLPEQRMANAAAPLDLGFEEEVSQVALTNSAKAVTEQKMNGNTPRRIVLKTSGTRRRSGPSGKSSSGKSSVISLSRILTRAEMVLAAVVHHHPAAARLVPTRVREQLLDSPLLALIKPLRDHLHGLPVQLHRRHILNF